MIPLFSTEQIRAIDSYAITQLGIPSIILMENAALEIFKIAVDKFSQLQNTVKELGFICGKGNNGGDGFAAARHFANHGYSVNVIYFEREDEFSDDALTNFRVLARIAEVNKKIHIKKYSEKRDLKSLKSCDVIFDAMLGSGARGKLKEPYSEIIRKINELSSFKIAIDIPTGLNADNGYAEEIFYADLTITLAEFKRGLFFGYGYSKAGEIIKGNIGIDNSYFNRYQPSDFLIEPEDVFELLPEKNKNAHKYSAGKVLTIAGSGRMPGSAVLTSKAVLKAGAGSSILAFPKSARKLIHKNLIEVIVESYDDDKKEILSIGNLKHLAKRIMWADVVAVGPGLGREPETQDAVVELIEKHKYKKIVLDADAIFALADSTYKNLNLQDAILTPHHGEFASLIGVDTSELKKDILSYGRKFVSETKSYLVLKGAPTIIFNPDGEALINTTGNPGMAKFGTGDVLTGILAAFLSQNMNIEDALVCGVYLHSLAADLLTKDMTEFSYTAIDIMNKLPSSIKFIRKSFA